MTCQAAGASCGTVADGCGGTLSCGECKTGETCGGGGKPNVCAQPPACQKTTCEAKKADCGTIPDGCGGELACGGCKSGDACGAGGAPNVCAPIPPTGNIGWTFPVSTPGPDSVLAVGNDGNGNRHLLTFTFNEAGPVHTLRLQKLGADGKLVWTKEFAIEGFGGPRPFLMSVTPAGNVYVAANAECHPDFGDACRRSIDVGGGRATDSVLVKLGPDGAFIWQRELTGSNVSALSVNDQESALVDRKSRTDATFRLEKYQHDGALLATVDGAGPTAAIDPSGNMITADFGRVTKYSASGARLWAKDLAGVGFPHAVATTAKGTVVLLATRTGDVTFGASQVRSGRLVLLVIEPDARERFARGFASLWFTSVWSPALAVDPTGRAAVQVSESCGAITVEAFDLSNADLWRRFLPDVASCFAPLTPGPMAYGADHRLFLGAAFSGAVQIGGKTFTPRGQDAVGVLLDP